MNDGVSVRNAGDRKQIKAAARIEQRLRERELADLKFVLCSTEGRRVLWRLLGKCRVFKTVSYPREDMEVNSGGRDIGLFILAEVGEANQESIFTMMREATVNEKRDQAEAEAAQIESKQDAGDQE